MCGIAGYCLADKDINRSGDAAFSMLLDIEHRGRHATGTAYITEDNRLRLHKKAIAASDYVNSLGERLCDRAKTAILHTRWATQGDPKHRENNHPIHRGDIVLTHNGHINNDDSLFKRLNVPRRGQVDSEAVAALLAFTRDNYHPTEVLPAVRGTAALAWFTFKDGRDTLHLARVQSSPLIIAQTMSGSFLYASTHEAIMNAAHWIESDLEWDYVVPEGEYLRVIDGRLVECARFKHYERTSFGPVSQRALQSERYVTGQIA
jgi:glucosamine--fructose-6-phosphate aminotransferase (isomerizing)